MADDCILHPALPPVLLTTVEAARYVGVSTDVFVAEVEAGLWPRPLRRGARGGKPTWHRALLDEAALRAAREAQPAAAPASEVERSPSRPANELTDRQRAILERMRHAARKDGAQRRDKAAA